MLKDFIANYSMFKSKLKKKDIILFYEWIILCFTIREKNSSEDMAFFSELDYESFKTTLKDQNISEDQKRAKYKNFLESDPLDPEGDGHVILILENEDRKRCGLIWIYNRNPFWKFTAQHAWIFNLHVIKEFRGQGLAHKLLQKGEEWARMQGLNSIALHVVDFNKIARHIYETTGYKLVATHNESCFYEKYIG